MNKNADVAYPIHDLLARRWSPRAFADRALSAEQLGSLFEAARWAPSCFNAQPWRFLAAERSLDPEGFERLASTLMDGNAWARSAAALILSVAETNFAHNGKPNRHAGHDVGLATENLVLQAEALGLATHQMGGFHADVARDVLGIPEGFEPMAMIAVGHPGDPCDLPAPLQERELAPRERLPLEAIAFGACWQVKP